MVNCNIILSESIAYAAQQFGLALYNSLGNSRELLAGQTGYLIDKNSIKLNCKYIYLSCHLFSFLFLVPLLFSSLSDFAFAAAAAVVVCFCFCC